MKVKNTMMFVHKDEKQLLNKWKGIKSHWWNPK
jgi:hypothetical protein